MQHVHDFAAGDRTQTYGPQPPRRVVEPIYICRRVRTVASANAHVGATNIASAPWFPVRGGAGSEGRRRVPAPSHPGPAERSSSRCWPVSSAASAACPGERRRLVPVGTDDQMGSAPSYPPALPRSDLVATDRRRTSGPCASIGVVATLASRNSSAAWRNSRCGSSFKALDSPVSHTEQAKESLPLLGPRLAVGDQRQGAALCNRLGEQSFGGRTGQQCQH